MPNQNQLLGVIVDSFTLMEINRALVLDRDSHELFNIGDIVRIELPSGQSIETKVLDGILDNVGGKDKVVTIRVENTDFKDNNVSGGKVFLKSKLVK